MLSGPRADERARPGPRLVRMAVIYVALVACFVMALTLVYSLPQAGMSAHLRQSVTTLESEGYYPRPLFSPSAYTLDNFTDSIMLDVAYKKSADSPLVAAMAGATGPGSEPLQSLSQTSFGNKGGVSSGSQTAHYSYYWHGYELFLRPAAMLMSYSRIRTLNLLLLVALTSAVLVLMWRSVGRRAVLAFVVTLGLSGYVIVPLSLQYSNMTYLALWAALGVMLILRKGVFERVSWEFFFVAGMLAAFFDLLTTPLLTLGIPLAIALIVRSRSEEDGTLVRQVLLVAVASLWWVVGYAASWLAKLEIGQIVLHENLLLKAYAEVLVRTGVSEPGAGRASVVLGNLLHLFPFNLVRGPVADSLRSAPYLAAVVAGLVVAAIGWALYSFRRDGRDIARSAAVLLVVPLPYLWFLVASNHSELHSMFTYRTQALAVFALLYFLLSVPDPGRVRSALAKIPSAGMG